MKHFVLCLLCASLISAELSFISRIKTDPSKEISSEAINETNKANHCLSVLAKVLAKEENDLQMSSREIRECIMIASAMLYSKASVEEEDEDEQKIFKRYRGVGGLKLNRRPVRNDINFNTYLESQKNPENLKRCLRCIGILREKGFSVKSSSKNCDKLCEKRIMLNIHKRFF